MAAYSASKAAVVTLSQSAAEDYRDKGFRIYAFSPGPIDTPMFQQALRDIGDSPEKYAGGLPMIKPMNPDIVAQEILKLAAPDAPHKNGSNVIFDTTH
jgi:NAD(P)-dependent dehydrogenase (short-subunit alcohol dehydrogenase family)